MTTDYTSSEVVMSMESQPKDKKNGYKIVNFVYNGHYELNNRETIDLKALSSNIVGAKKDDRFSGLVWHGERWTMLLFKNGKFVLTGIKKISDADIAVESMKEILLREKYSVLSSDKHVTNIVCNGSFHVPIDLNSFIVKMENSRYEPEVFPGLVYHDHGTTFLIFGNGNYVCLGAEKVERIGEAVEELSREIENNDLYIRK